MAHLGFVNVKDVMLGTQRKIMAFSIYRIRFHIPRNYNVIWSQLQEISTLEYPILDLTKATLEVV